jgi:UDP-N-acetylmuramyl pentapeptide phosphotransferase/UDP-N-acetylglucosamine-1-phosphate transferase
MLILILTARYHSKWSSGPKEAIQNIHQGLVPRLGGLAIILGMWMSELFIGLAQINPLITMSMLAASAIFMIGFAEDLTSSLKVLWRLALTLVPPAVLAYHSQIYLTHLGWAPADALLSSQVIAIIFTAFAIAGVTHAFNLVDGLNGLISFIALWILGAYTVLGYLYDDHLVIQMCLLLGAPLLGFLFFNWPLGKCFLGDGGAYLLGFLLAWIGVLLAERHQAISPFAILLICAYPVIETLYSMARRILRGKNSGRPDKAHLHQMFQAGVIAGWLKSHSTSMKSNSVAGLLISLLTIPFAALAIYFNTQKTILVCLFLLALALYWALYQQCKDQIAHGDGAN